MRSAICKGLSVSVPTSWPMAGLVCRDRVRLRPLRAGGPSSSSLGCVRAVCQRASMLVHKEGFEYAGQQEKI